MRPLQREPDLPSAREPLAPPLLRLGGLCSSSTAYEQPTSCPLIRDREWKTKKIVPDADRENRLGYGECCRVWWKVQCGQDKADVLVGTQMIAKGHDFPNITLVVVVNGDTALQVPDFRSGETTVQLLMQV
jgi:hypothetical protein